MGRTPARMETDNRLANEYQVANFALEGNR